jgi:hypothetical protein
MSDPDPITTGVVLAGALQAAKQAQDFLAAATGHPGESLGTIIGNVIHRRIENAERILSRAHLTLLNIGVTPKEIPLNILHPAIEGASLQEDEFLKDTWANLLANAADPRHRNKVAPSFPAILKELSPHDAKLVQSLYQSRLDATVPSSTRCTDAGFPYDQFLASYGAAGLSRWAQLNSVTYGDMDKHRDAIRADRQEAEAAKDLLIRCGLLQNVTSIKPVKVGARTTQVPGGMHTQIPQALKVEHSTNLRFTQFGLDFVRACQPPTPAS